MSDVISTATKPAKSLKPLSNLYPYLLRYKGQVAAALFFLTLAAVTTLALPTAVRRMIDKGFNAADSAFINSYFLMLIALAALLAMASAGRYISLLILENGLWRMCAAMFLPMLRLCRRRFLTDRNQAKLSHGCRLIPRRLSLRLEPPLRWRCAMLS